MDPITHTILPYTRMTVKLLALDLHSYLFQSNVIIDEYFDDLGVAYRAEIKELYGLGCRKPGLCLLSVTNIRIQL